MASSKSRAGISVSQPNIQVDTTQIKKLVNDLRAMSPESAAVMRRGIREIVGVVRDEAKARTSYSTRIPGSVRARVSARGFSGRVIAGGVDAPDASPIENKGKGYVRHPVFGDTTKWTAKNSHPAFLAPAAEKNIDVMLEMMSRLLQGVVDSFARK